MFVKVHDQILDNILKKNATILLCFFGNYQNQGKLIQVIEICLKQFSGRLLFYVVESDSADKYIEFEGVYGYPTLQIFKNGKMIDQIVGKFDLEILMEKLNTTLNIRRELS